MTQEDMIQLAKDAGLLDKDFEVGDWEIHEFTTFAKLVAKHEREACANTCYELMLNENPYDQWNGMKLCMEAIRARKQV